MRDRTSETETAALLRRLKRQGVREVEWDSRAKRGTVRLRAKVQAGRAHKLVETAQHDTQEEALAELSQLVAEHRPAAKGRQRPKSTARPLQRPEAGRPGVPELPPPAEGEERPQLSEEKRIERNLARRAELRAAMEERQKAARRLEVPGRPRRSAADRLQNPPPGAQPVPPDVLAKLRPGAGKGRGGR